MIKTLVLCITLFFFASTAFPVGLGIGTEGGRDYSGGTPAVADTWVGFANNSGTPDDGGAIWGLYGTNEDRCYGHYNVFTGQSGTIVDINSRFYFSSDAPTGVWAAAYNGGTLLGQASLTHVADAWTGAIDLVEESSGSLDFSTGATIHFVVCWDIGAGYTQLSMDTSGTGPDAEFENDVEISGGPPTSGVAWETSGSGHDIAIIMGVDID